MLFIAITKYTVIMLMITSNIKQKRTAILISQYQKLI